MSLFSLDLQKLIGGPRDSLVFNIQLIHNRRLFSISALGDTGADSYVFINSLMVIILGKRFGLRVERLGCECLVRGFNGKLVEPIRHMAFLTICIDRRI